MFNTHSSINRELKIIMSCVQCSPRLEIIQNYSITFFVNIHCSGVELIRKGQSFRQSILYLININSTTYSLNYYYLYKGNMYKEKREKLPEPLSNHSSTIPTAAH